MGQIFNLILIPVGYILQLCYKIAFGNYTVSLLVFALIMQIILLPFAIKQQKNMIKQAKLSPKIMAIRKKYQGRNDQATQQKMQQETMNLYQKENFNPASGCLPLLIQMPILLALFQVVIRPLQFLCNLSTDTIQAIFTAIESRGAAVAGPYYQLSAITYLNANKSQFDSIMSDAGCNLTIDKLPHMTIFGKIDLSGAPYQAGFLSWMIVIPILTVLVMLASQWITKKFTYQSPETQDAQSGCSMKVMMYSMPILSGYFAYRYAAAIGIYWIFRNIITTIQQIVLAKVMPIPHFTDEDYKAAERELRGSKTIKKSDKEKNADPDRPKVRSLHHIDDEDDGYTLDSPKKVKSAENAEDNDTSEENLNKDDSESRLNADAPTSVSTIAEAPLKEDKGKKFKKKK